MSTAPTAPSMSWIDAHYEHAGLDKAHPHLVCRRCGQQVDWLTQHAVVRHGDTDVEVFRPVRPEPEGGWKW